LIAAPHSDHSCAAEKIIAIGELTLQKA